LHIRLLTEKSFWRAVNPAMKILDEVGLANSIKVFTGQLAE
jgi:hypothetical protein